MQLTNVIAFIVLAALQVASAAISDARELTAIRGDRFSVMFKELFAAADNPHGDCEYSGIEPGVWYRGHCRTGIHYGPSSVSGSVGMCVVPGLKYPDGSPVDGTLCDIRWKGTANSDAQSPCANYQDSQFACKHDGDSCQVYHFAEDPSLGVAHCQWPNTVIN